MKRTKIAIIGCGIITEEAHLPALKRLSDRLEIIAVCNRSKSKAEKIAKNLDIKPETVWTDWQEMIKEVGELDAVLIALPITLNHPVSKACCEAGLSVICEKPAGMSTEEAEDTADFSSRYGVTFMTAENFHFDPKFNKVAELVQSGLIGKLHSICWNLFSFMDKDNKYNKTRWRAHNEYPGGYVLDGGVHFVHALQMVAGPVKAVYARTASIEADLGTMDLAFSLLEHKEGVISSLNMGWRSADDDNFLKLYGEKGSLIVKDDFIVAIDPQGTETKHIFEKESSFYLQWCDFLSAIEKKKSLSIPPQMPVDDVKIIMAMIESGQTGKRIILS